ncbi:uncharacterized protein LOC132046868 isoform X2 [Lycium ferocissimum]|uniref:uncharacterized protein LOC132046868 isoform X2 n=1 Tax=Lycium ferocissimum TaxID=112874 RepID=UPI0028168302|nr:uncharacterized protein LOC132046868 isoform X2 [Lycium ferocissimum]
MEANEAQLPTSPSSFNFSQQRHFYLAVDRLHFKMETLVDLLGMAGRLRCLPIVVSCSTRDELDAVCSALSSLSHTTIAALYSDLAEAERATVLARFRQATMRWNKQATAEHGHAGETEKEEEKSHLVVVTDACLPLVNSGESPINARVLINYELPTKKVHSYLCIRREMLDKHIKKVHRAIATFYFSKLFLPIHVYFLC